MGFSRQENWSGLPFPPPGDLPDPRMEPMSPAPLALAGGFLYHRIAWEPLAWLYSYFIFIGIWLLCNIVQCLLYSKVNQLCVYIYLLFIGFPFHLGHHRVLSGVPCAEQCIYTSHLFYISIIYICVSRKWDEEDNSLMAGERHQFSKRMGFCVVLCLYISVHWQTFPGFLLLTST